MPNFKNLSRYVALKIKVDFETGERAGGIDPTDPNLYCHPSWQNLEDGYEIRLVLDNRDISIYQNIAGIEIIEGIENIDNAILELNPNEEQYLFARDDALLQASVIAKHQDPNDSFSVNNIPDDSTTITVQSDGVYVGNEKLFGEVIAQKLANKLGKTVPFTIQMAQLSSEQKNRIIHLWLMRHGVKGIRMIRRIRKLSEMIG